jgi:flavorubredoxin
LLSGQAFSYSEIKISLFNIKAYKNWLPAGTKSLIVYGTRNDGTAEASDKIARVLREEGINVKVVNLNFIQ